MPDMDSTVTQEQMMERFGTETDAMSAPSATITLQAPEGKKLTDKAVMGEVDSMIKELQGTDALKDPDAIVNPVMASMGMQKQMTEKMAAQGMPQEQIDSDLAALSLSARTNAPVRSPSTSMPRPSLRSLPKR